MSSEYAEKLSRIKSAVNGRELNRMLDAQRVEFLEALSRTPVRLTEWEHQFVQDLILAPRSFTDPQRDAVDELRRKYECRLAVRKHFQPAHAAEERDNGMDVKTGANPGSSTRHSLEARKGEPSPADSFTGNAS